MTEFLPCSTCKSHSQAHLYHYARDMISKHAECTVARLRYLLGGDRPSQTVHLTLSFNSLQSWKLEKRYHYGGITGLTPYKLASILQSLPPML